MGSIYKKGRDGFYYYQTYVFNPDTKKMDKRIFHSLQTKERLLAEKKKIEYDLIYARNKGKRENSPIIKPFLNELKLFIPITISVIILLFSVYIIINNQRLEIEQLVEEMEVKDSQLVRDNYLKTVGEGENDLNIRNERIIQETKKPEIKIQNDNNLNIPNYKLISVETYSSRFNQCKIIVTANENSNKDQLLLICRKLKSEYKSFSDIIICIYSNSENSFNPASGNSELINNKDTKSAWLTLYTYNKVEGEFFDTKPGRFL
jgi:hypothetical protein